MSDKIKETKIDLQGKQGNLKVDAETITLEMPNTKGLSLEEVESNMKVKGFCSECTGVFAAVGSFL